MIESFNEINNVEKTVEIDELNKNKDVNLSVNTNENEKLKQVVESPTNNTLLLDSLKTIQMLQNELMLEKQKTLNMLNDNMKLRQIVKLYASLGVSDEVDPRSVMLMSANNVGFEVNKGLQPIVPVMNRVITPNPHLDKLILSHDDLKDVIAWALNNVTEKPDDYLPLLREKFKTTPEGTAERVAAAIGSLFYGDNKFIGPSKSGLIGEATLEQAVLTVPVTSLEDAAARAHDIGVSITDSAHVDAILPPAAEFAQNFSPLFISRPVGRQRGVITNKQLIKKAGDVESNPGPGDSILERGGYMIVTERNNILDFALGACFKQDGDDLQTHYFRNVHNIDDVYQILNGVSDLYEVQEGLSWTMHGFEMVLVPVYICHYVKRQQLLLSGDVELNPGPRENQARVQKLNPFTSTVGVTDIDKMLTDPTDAMSYINVTPGASFYNLKAKLENGGTATLRSGADNLTDPGLANCNWSQVGGYSTDGYGGASTSRSRASYRLATYGFSNRIPRADKIPYGELGTGLGNSLMDFPNFTAAERTNTNSVSGNSLLQIYSRTPVADFGDYIQLTRLICYSTLATPFIFTGTFMDCWLPDCMNIINATENNVMDGLFPGSSNDDAAALPDIDAIVITQETYAEFLLGKQPIPFGWDISDDSRVAIIPIDQSWSVETVALVTICHLEFPFCLLDPTANGINANISTNANAVSTAAASLNPLMFTGSKIEGPRERVIYVLGSNSTAPLVCWNLQVQEYDPSAPTPATDISMALAEYINNSLLQREVAPVLEAFDYFGRFATMQDYKAACLFAGSIIQRKVPYMPHQVIGGAATPVPVLGTVIPTWNPSIAIRTIGNVGGRTANLQAAISATPTYNQFGFIDYYSVMQPVGTARASVPACATYQMNTGLTRYGIYIGILKKKTMAAANMSGFFKGNLNALAYAIWNSSDICMAITAEWFIENGVTNHMLYFPGPVAVSKRTSIWTKLADLWLNWQSAYVGIPFMRMAMPSLAVTDPNYEQPLYMSISSWYKSPVVLTNRHLFDNLVEIDFAPNVTLMNSTAEAFEFGAQAIVNAGPGNQMGGPSAVQAIRSIMYKEVKIEGTSSTEEVMQLWAKNVYAQSNTQHLANNNIYGRWSSLTLRERQGGGHWYLNPVFMYFTDWLRLINASISVNNYRDGVRPLLGMSLPVYPPDYDPVQGFQLLLSATSDGDINAARPMISLDGSGTYVYGLLKSNSSTQAFRVANNPF
jgi:hypothetical protein